MTDDPGYVHYKRTGQLRMTAACRRYGHRMDDGSLPTCTRVGCDEGMAEVWMYLDLEAEQCTCGTETPCDWHEVVPEMQAENYAAWVQDS